MVFDTVANLITAHGFPFHHVGHQARAYREQIEIRLREQFIATPAPSRASVDLRNAGFTLAQVSRFYAYVTISRLAPLAAFREIEQSRQTLSAT